MVLNVQGLSYSYGQAPALTEVGFQANFGEFVAILGANGAGKSTLFRCLLGLLPRYQGSVKLNGQEIRTMRPASLARCAAYIPQSTAPIFDYTVLEMVLMGMTGQIGAFSTPGREQVASAQAALTRLGMDFLAGRGFCHISGGERQLTLIARALVQGAKLLLLDEPTANLDYGNQHRVMAQLRALADEGYTVLLATHNPEHALMYASRVLALERGHLIADGSAGQVLTEALLTRLYGMDVGLATLADGTQVCLPKR